MAAKEKSIKYYRLFSNSTSQDKLLIFFGAILAISSGSLHQYCIFLIGDVTEVMFEYTLSVNKLLIHTEQEMEILKERLYSSVRNFAIEVSFYGVIIIIACYISSVLLSFSASRQIFSVRQLILKKILNMDIAWFDNNKTVDFATIFTDNLSKFEEGIGGNVSIFFFYASVFISGNVIVLILVWNLGLFCLVPAIIISIFVPMTSILTTKFSNKEVAANGAAGMIAEEVLTLIKTVIAFGGQEKEHTRYKNHLLKARKYSLRKNLYLSLTNSVLWLLSLASIALIIYYGVQLVIDDLNLQRQVNTPGRLISVFFCVSEAAYYAVFVAPILESFGTACGAAEIVFEILNLEPTIHQNVGKIPHQIKGQINFENVTFSYACRPDVQVLNNFTLQINPGETVALVGHSGCGKSTCIQLIQRLFDVTSGSLLIDQTNIKHLNLTWLRSKIGVVSQEPVLFSSTIAENIKMGLGDVAQEEIEEAARWANIHDFIINLPLGYDTLIGGTRLSGGQKQKIAIARALIRKPKILLLDEATSVLDAKSEAEVDAAINQVTWECTKIIVTHRLSTIQKADRIVVFKEGRIVENDNHLELMKNQKSYYDLVKQEHWSEVPQYNPFFTDTKDFSTQQLTYSPTFPIKEKLETLSIQTAEENKAPAKDFVSSIFELSKPDYLLLLIACASAIIRGIALPVYGLLFGLASGIISETDYDVLEDQSIKYAFYFLAIAVVGAFATFLYIYLFEVAGENLTLRVRERMFNTILSKPQSWFDRSQNGIGALCAKLSGDSVAVQGVAGKRIGVLLNMLATFIFSNIVSMYFQWKLALVLQIFTALLLVFIYLLKIVLKRVSVNEENLESSTQIAVEAISSIKTITSLNAQHRFFENYTNTLQFYVNNKFKQIHLAAFLFGIGTSIVLFGYSIAVGYGGQLVVSDHVNYGTIYLVAETIIMGYDAIGNAIAASPNLRKGVAAARRVFGLLNENSGSIRSSNLKTINDITGDISFRNVNFSYPSRPSVTVLDNLELHVPRGKTIAIVGASGCGKTTLLQLIQGFYEPSGKICFDSNNIDNINLDKLRSHFGMVSQEPNLFATTIAENIAYGAIHKSISMDDIIQSAKLANIHTFISSLPLGYDTCLGIRGAQLSGGQKQRIAIARALIRNPKILLLDEATSALDFENERIVQEALDRARRDKTCIIIAHRLRTIQNADWIYVLDRGSIVESGNHFTLMKLKGFYYRFYNEQLHNV